MTNIELIVLGLSYSQTQNGAYALVLAEKNGNRRIPIIIGSSEAQSIAVQLEKLVPLRPLTHDLFVNFANEYEVRIKRVNIVKLEEGIFYSELVCERKGSKTIIDARTSDAVALALRFDCPIYTNESILDNAGIVLDEDTKKSEPYSQKTENKEKRNLSTYTTEELENILQDAIEKEDYEIASKIRDEINKRKEE